MTVSIVSWNVNGIRSKIINEKTSTKKGDILVEDTSNLSKLIGSYSPDIICLSEVRCSEEISGRIKMYEYPYKYYNQSTRTERGRGAGYSGTAIWSKLEPLRVVNGLPTLDEPNIEGRVIMVEFKEYYLINVYTPNSGSNEDYRLYQWDKAMLKYINSLKEEKEVVLMGDMNVCHRPPDYYGKISEKKRVAGLLPEEIYNFSEYIENDFLDTFRYKNPNVNDGFTWWSPLYKQCRVLNKGWRLDYAIISNGLLEKLEDSSILSEIMGSDHCPILLKLKI